MGLANELAIPVDVRIGERDMQMSPLTLYDLAQLEIPYIEWRHHVVSSETSWMSPEEQRKAHDEVNRQRALLSDDLQPILKWIVLDAVGQVTATQLALKNSGYDAEERDVAVWLSSQEAADAYTTWLIRSGIIPDPTKSSTTKTEDQSSEATQPQSETKDSVSAT